LDAGPDSSVNRLDYFLQFFCRYFSAPARPKRFIEREVAHFNTAQSDDLVAERGKHPLDLMISPLMEHHLGLTCDPVRGLVQIPCIERNAVAAMRAINALSLANFLTYTRKISFDVVVNTMYETGRDLFSKYRETGEGGLAKYYTGKK